VEELIAFLIWMSSGLSCRFGRGRLALGEGGWSRERITALGINVVSE